MQADTPRQTLTDLFRDHGQDLPLGLSVALIAADERPEIEVDSLLGRLDDLAAEIPIRGGAPLFESTARLHMSLFTELGLRGDEQTYGDPRNSCLDQVLDRRMGLPILLSVVYIEVARRLDISVDGIGFPGHFLVSPHDADTRFFVDPFHQGRILTREHLQLRLMDILGDPDPDGVALEQFTRPATTASILVRINNNLKRSWASQNDLEGALRAVERNLVLAPDELDEQRDRGMILAELGRLDQAIDQLERYLEHELSGWDQARVTAIIDVLRRR